MGTLQLGISLLTNFVVGGSSDYISNLTFGLFSENIKFGALAKSNNAIAQRSAYNNDVSNVCF